MTEPSKTTRAKAHAKNAADEASKAANEATEAVTDGVRSGFTAVRNNEEVQKLTKGVRNFVRRAEDPFLVGLTLFNPPVGLGVTGIVKGSRLVSRGLQAEAEAEAQPVDTAK